MDAYYEIFTKVKEYVKQHVSEVAYGLWIDGLEAISINGTSAKIAANTDFIRSIVVQRYLTHLTEGFEAAMGFPIEVEVLCKPDTLNSDEEEANNLQEQEYLFSNFVVGSSNSFAHAASRAVAEKPGTCYNPLFLYGQSGLGKTHLLYAIFNEVKAKHPEYKMLYVKGEDFTNELIAAIGRGTTAEFKEKYRQVDFLAVDDIQFIAGKIQTEEEFFHTFNALKEHNKQIVLTSDRPPKEIKTLEERLRTRFEWGLLADIQPPDYETRVAIISKKAESLGLEMPEDVSSYIASKLSANVRQLEGVVKRLYAHKQLAGTPITMLLAENAIQDLLTSQQPLPITVDRIIDEVARTYNVTSEDIRGLKRNGNISVARQVAMYVVREVTGMSQNDIGKQFGDRDHATVLYALRQVTNDIERDSHKKELISDIIKNIKTLE